MKTIGILGGLGPQATIDFELRLHRVAQRLIPQQGNVGYPPLISWFFREPPVAWPADGPPPTALPPANPRLLHAARSLGVHADFLVIPSNGVHLWQTEIEAAAGKPVVSMVDAVLDEVERRRYRRVGLVDFRPAALSVYCHPLERRGAAPVELPGTMQEGLVGVMRAVVEGRNGVAEEAYVRQAVAHLRDLDTDGIILACTEFPLALNGGMQADVINPAELLAEAAVRAAIA
jgi:aspartate racemase